MFLYICFMSKTISLLNFKGGVGKTTSTYNIGYYLAKQGYKVLLIDADAQFNLSQMAAADQTSSLYKILKKQSVVNPHKISDNFDIIPSSLELIKADIELSGQIHREYILDKALRRVKRNYDFVLIDCAPSLGLTTVNAIFTSDLIFVPIEAEYLSLTGYSVLTEALDNIDYEIDKVFITKYDSRKVLNRSVKDSIFDKLENNAFQTPIRQNVALAEAPTSNQSIFEYAPDSNGAKDYESLTKEIIKEYG